MATEDQNLEREKWQQEVIWRERDFQLRQEGLKHSRSEWRISIASMVVSVAAILGSVWAAIHVSSTAASATLASAERSASSAQDSAQRSAAAVVESAARNATAVRDSAEKNAKAARASLERKWQLDLQEDQRKAVAAVSVEFVAALLPALNLTDETIDRARRSEPSTEDIDAYDRAQRKNLVAIHLASARLYLENRDVAFAFSPVYEGFKKIDNDVMAVGRSTNRNPLARANAWCRLGLRVKRLNLAPALDKVRAGQLRPGIAAPQLEIKAPNRLREIDPFAPDPEEAKCYGPQAH